VPFAASALPLTYILVAIEVGKINMGTSFLLSLAAFGIYLLGLLAICVGLIFAAPLVNMIFSVAYLMMKGELRAA